MELVSLLGVKTGFLAPCVTKCCPVWSALPLVGVAVVEIASCVVLARKPEEQGQVPRCLTLKGDPSLWSQAVLPIFGWDFGSEMPWPLLNIVSVLRTWGPSCSVPQVSARKPGSALSGSAVPSFKCFVCCWFLVVGRSRAFLCPFNRSCSHQPALGQPCLWPMR